MPPKSLLIASATLPLVIWTAAIAVAAATAQRVIHPRRAAPTKILRIEGNTVTLSNTPLTRYPGVLGLLYDDEHHLVALTPHIHDDAGHAGISRMLQAEPRPPIRTGAGRAVGNVFPTPHDVDGRAFEVELRTQLGPAPAWIFPSEHDSGTWLVHLHGSLSGREGALRSVAAVTHTGLPSIVPSFRGDSEGPAAPRGAFMLGQTEWPDIEPALGYAIDHGAQRIVLIGWSNGASIAYRLAASSAHRHHIVGVVAISPVLDWPSAIRFGVEAAGLPRMIASLAIRGLATPGLAALLGAAEPLRFQDLTWLIPPAPTLLLHSPGDRTVPYADSVAMKERNVDLIDLPALPPAPHALEWNGDPDLIAQLITQWLEALLHSAASST